ncbi:UDP-N-acetylglucosamine 1-carboxyvinyltransferase [Salsipaludibacter albus]|uniref:UDP-N-acetylglucosamine 1-carboxyvinyltransferase n=1 Tax=Salsipaludibacter albus TaxID=2849650 RepID=UPI001EE3ADA6|nr:UDP-N-acetylglucosamine 1-carboxyvinyltransferase [Salsipaludibacter albus]MBY5163354.1 UDP-N-acetylglucosamine 1-carboxyvinyltransferase [Salsipaludibacter albus]
MSGATPPDETSLQAGEVFAVTGGTPLSGTVRVPGAKNSALKLIAASLLTDAPVRLADVPDIADVPVMVDLVRSVGASVERDGDVVEIVADSGIGWQPERNLMTAIRASTSLLGPLVGRVRRARLVRPGGDKIGARGIDLHLSGLVAMGARLEEGPDHVDVLAPDLHGARITLEYASVGATENLVMAAVLADGVTTIDNAAREPEIQDLCRMLVAMGASIDGIGTGTVTIQGVDRLEGVSWTVVPDRIEAGTWMVAAAITAGDVLVDNVRPAHHEMLLRVLDRAGVSVTPERDHVRVTAQDLLATRVLTLPYPGFPTDMQPQMMVLLTQAHGLSQCTENVFESRYSFVDELRRMGADITVEGHHAVIRGPTTLHGAHLDALDIRAGAAGVLAGLVATGTTHVHDIHHVDRGYPDFAGRLRALGADIERLPASAGAGEPR